VHVITCIEHDYYTFLVNKVNIYLVTKTIQLATTGTTMLSLSESAKETGLTRSAIFKAIKSGRLSATKDAQGRFVIDPVELHRVYGVNMNQVNEIEQLATKNNTQETGGIELMRLLLKQVESERDDLRRRLDEESAERRKLMSLLTHQPETAQETQKPEPSRLWLKLFGNR